MKLLGKTVTASLLAALIVGGSPARGSAHGGAARTDLAWLEGYALVLLDNDEMAATLEAREFVETRGGRVAVVTSPRAMLGWVPPHLIDELVGQHGIVSIHHDPVLPENLPIADEPTRSLVRSFNAVVSQQYQAARSTRARGAKPLINDALAPPEISYEAYIENLRGTTLETPSRSARAARSTEGSLLLAPGNSDAMTGTVAVKLFFLESNGEIDPDLYTWTAEAQDDLKTQVVVGLSFWAAQAATHGASVTFVVSWYDRAFAEMAQAYEPILHSSATLGVWIDAVMANLGFDSGDRFARVAAFNSVLRVEEGTDWAFSAFIVYNPPSAGAPDSFKDGYFAYAYYGGPYTQLCYKNDGWGVSLFGNVFAHETGHIFWACDEYHEPGYGGCWSCGSCLSWGPRPWAVNANCEYCNPSAVSCVMKENVESLCSYTPAQVGWPPVCGNNVAEGDDCDGTDDANCRGLCRPPGDPEECTCPPPICGNGVKEIGEHCDDGNTEDGDCCSTTCQSEAPRVTCRKPVEPFKALLSLKDHSDDDRDRLVWKWIKGESTARHEFGDPTSTTAHRICVYYEDDGKSPRLILLANAPAGGQCAGRECWRAGRKGFRYKDKGRTHDGLYSVLLKSGEDGKAKVIVKGRGANLDLPSPLDVELPVTVQLQADNGECWEARYFSIGVNKNEPNIYKARAGSPSRAFLHPTSSVFDSRR